MLIFVYGTLLKGMERAYMLKQSKFKGPAIAKGNLYDLGDYPGIKDGENIIIGELYEINDETLSKLDVVEDYNEDDINSSLFVRKKINACEFSEGRMVEVFAYYYNHEVDDRKFIAHGDYRRYLLEKEGNDQFVIAYGSNMSSKRLSDRVGKLDEYKKGYIEGFKLVFNKKSDDKNTSYANIKYTGKDKCPCIAWKLSRAQVETLDGFEEVPSHYLRITVPMQEQNGRELIAQVYIASPDSIAERIQPEEWYLKHIQDGYKENGFYYG
ncbi:MAG: gamma-glutamylcyclotransferase [Desulfobacterales bacterium]|nr:gamma-glutamylcyclotransferase [Desulfobacterales bacterium]